jgi:hypothetical protein
MFGKSKLTLHRRAWRETSDGTDRRCMRVMASFTLLRYVAARELIPPSTSPLSLPDRTVLMNLKAAEFTHIE